MLFARAYLRHEKINVFSKMSSSLTFSLYSFNCELILNKLELYSFTNLKSYSLKVHPTCFSSIWVEYK